MQTTNPKKDLEVSSEKKVFHPYQLLPTACCPGLVHPSYNKMLSVWGLFDQRCVCGAPPCILGTYGPRCYVKMHFIIAVGVGVAGNAAAFPICFMCCAASNIWAKFGRMIKFRIKAYLKIQQSLLVEH